MLDLGLPPSEWQALGSMLQGVGTLGGAFAVWWVARRAVRDWREQKQVENQIAAADRVLTDCHNLCHFSFEHFDCLTLSHIESPVNWAEVEDDAKARLVFESFERAQTFSTVEFMAKRRQLAESRNTALIYFGEEAARHIDVILNCTSKINTWVFLAIFKDFEAKERRSFEADGLTYEQVTQYSQCIADDLTELRRQLTKIDAIVSAYIRKI